MNAERIPVIDVSALTSRDAAARMRVDEKLCRAAAGAGFFYVEGHGISTDLIDQTFAVSKRFFGTPAREKSEVIVSPHHRGWLAIGEARMYGIDEPDLKESFVWGLDIDQDDADFLAGGRLHAPNRWPGFLPEMRPVLMEYFAATQACGERLLEAFARGLEIAPDYFIREFDKPVSRCTLIHYPPHRGRDTRPGSGAHTDYGMLTLLNQDDVGGLQVRDKSGAWTDVAPIAGTYVVNIGDLLARWSNGRFASTPHRVMSSKESERYSVATFIDPNWDALLTPAVAGDEPARFEPVRCADYIAARFNEAFAYRGTEPSRDARED